MNAQALQVVMVEDIPRYHPIYEESIHEAVPGALVSFAVDGQAALDLVRSLPKVDLIILDLNIPKIHGKEVLADLRNDPAFDNVPIMILTGDSDKELQSQLLEMGADDFIEKGAPPAIFAARLRAQMRHKLAFNQMTQMAMDMDIFTAGVLHDIRNIETSISALCDLIRMQLQEDPVANRDRVIQDVASLKGQAHRMSNYATNILQNLKQTSSQPKVEALDLVKVGEWVKAMLSGASTRSGETGLSVGFIKPLQAIAGDTHLIELVFLNLCQNSIRYARTGVPAEIMIYQRPSSGSQRTSRPMLVTCVRDNGIGIPKDDLRKVFQPFVRGNCEGSRLKSGFGLGLALVSKAVSLMGGRVWAELPEDGKPGTVMCIELPLAS